MSDAGLRESLALWRSGRAQDALVACRELERRHPRDARIPGLMAAIHAGGGRTAEAIDCLGRAIALAPRDCGLHYQLGTLQLGEGRHDAAITSFERALSADARFAPALNNLGHAYLRSGRLFEAVATLSSAAHHWPGDAIIAFSLGSARRAAGDLPGAIQALERSIELNPRGADAWTSLVEILEELGPADECAAAARRAESALPGDPRVLAVAGKALATAGALAESVDCLERAVAGNPADVASRINLGITRMRLGYDFAARADLETAVQAAPGNARALYNFGMLEYRSGNLAAAIVLQRRAIAADPAFALAHHSLASWLLETKGPLEDAIAHAERACEHSPANPLFVATALMAHTTAWNLERLGGLWTKLRAIWGAGQAVPAGLVFAGSSDPAEHRSAAEARAASIRADLQVAASGRSAARSPRTTGERLRVGYLSPDFGEHPVGLSMVEVLEHHDRRRFETYGLSLLERETSPTRTRLIEAVEHFEEVGHLDATRLAGFIRNLDLDILVDLAGYTTGARPEVLATRPAPIQVSYLGFPGTMGADWIDYLIADRVVIAEPAEAFFRERVVVLPQCFFPTDTRARPPIPVASRAEEGLPAEAVVLCCFNLSARITGPVVDAWCRILAAVPRAVLWLGAMHAIAERNLREYVAHHGVDSGRLVFARHLPSRADHLARHALADLYLDTYPYNGHSTARDALLLGVPVVTCAGPTFPSRVAASLLLELGIPELVTASLDDYTRVAIGLANNDEARARLRTTVASRFPASPLADARSLAGHLESAYTTMAELARAGRPAEGFAVLPPGGRSDERTSLTATA